MKPHHWQYLLAMLSGILLAASDWPLRWTGLHYIALVPIFIGYFAWDNSTKPDWRTGSIFALTYGGLIAASAATVIPVWLAVFWGLLQYTIVFGYAGQMVRVHWLLGPAAAAATAALVDILVWHWVPVFGMAQCFARVTSAAPMTIQFAAYTGLAGVVFALVFTQAIAASLLANMNRPDKHRVKKCAVLLGLIALIAAVNVYRWNRKIGPAVNVAAFGWSGGHELSLADICGQAQAAGAEILVTPELGFSIHAQSADDQLGSMAREVRSAGLQAAIGVARYDLRENQALLIDTAGSKTYTKSHLIAFLENSRPGGGELVQTEWSGARCGVMICQDDNFSDLARGYSRDGVQLMLVPTMDWNPICGLHYESSVMRSIENGYAVCRGAIGGISALITPRGEIIASHNHNTLKDAKCISAALPTGDGQPTIYARCGDWPMAIFCLAILANYCYVVTTATKRSPALP